MLHTESMPCRCPWCRRVPDQSLQRISRILHEPSKPMSPENEIMLREIVADAVRKANALRRSEQR